MGAPRRTAAIRLWSSSRFRPREPLHDGARGVSAGQGAWGGREERAKRGRTADCWAAARAATARALSLKHPALCPAACVCSLKNAKTATAASGTDCHYVPHASFRRHPPWSGKSIGACATSLPPPPALFGVPPRGGGPSRPQQPNPRGAGPSTRTLRPGEGGGVATRPPPWGGPVPDRRRCLWVGHRTVGGQRSALQRRRGGGTTHGEAVTAGVSPAPPPPPPPPCRPPDPTVPPIVGGRRAAAPPSSPSPRTGDTSCSTWMPGGTRRRPLPPCRQTRLCRRRLRDRRPPTRPAAAPPRGSPRRPCHRRCRHHLHGPHCRRRRSSTTPGVCAKASQRA